jgi:hypothetical protein
MGEKMANMETWIRDFTFSKRIRNFRVLSATCAVSMTEEKKLYKNRILKEMWGHGCCPSFPERLRKAWRGHLFEI